MEKTCPKCSKSHSKPGIFCSRSCANSRQWSEEHKLKVSNSCKNSEKVIKANSNPEKRKRLSEVVKKQAKDGNINYMAMHTTQVREKINKTNKQKRLKRLESEDYKNRKKYRQNCQFVFNLKDYSDEFNFHLIKEYGWYSAPNRGGNTNGISRDHMYSISDGFKNKVSPLIISHPANCQLMRHEENFHSKNSKSSINLDKLKNLIDIWGIKYNIND